MSTIKNVVLVHGGFVDGSGWEGVFQRLKGPFHASNLTVRLDPLRSLGIASPAKRGR